MFCDAYVETPWVPNNDDLEPDCSTNDTDPCGICGGPGLLVSCLDSDDDGFGDPNDMAWSCNIPTGYVIDCSDEDDECQSNEHDCMGTCDGDAEELIFWPDIDGDGLGFGSDDEGELFCNGLDLSGLAPNNDDVDDACQSNIHDCNGVCDGDAELDDCGVCDSDISNDCVQDCTGEWGGSLENDECGICGGDNSSCADCAGVPYGDAVNLFYC